MVLRRRPGYCFHPPSEGYSPRPHRHKNLCGSRVALVGGIAPGFTDLYDDERLINKRFEGLYFNRLHEYSEIKDRALSFNEDEILPIAENMISCSGGILNEHVKETLLISARIYKAYKEFISQNHYDAIAVSCWPNSRMILSIPYVPW